MTTLLATLEEQMVAQTAERRKTGRPLQKGDLLHDPGHGYVEVVDAGNAGDCAEARVNRDIRECRARKGIERL